MKNESNQYLVIPAKIIDVADIAMGYKFLVSLNFDENEMREFHNRVMSDAHRAGIWLHSGPRFGLEGYILDQDYQDGKESLEAIKPLYESKGLDPNYKIIVLSDEDIEHLNDCGMRIMEGLELVYLSTVHAHYTAYLSSDYDIEGAIIETELFDPEILYPLSEESYTDEEEHAECPVQN